MTNFCNVGVYIFSSIRKRAKAEITFEVFALTANTVYLGQSNTADDFTLVWMILR